MKKNTKINGFRTHKIGNISYIFKNLLEEIPCGVEKIIEVFKKNNFKILIPGGFVRDVLLNKIPSDIDFATNLNPDEIEKLLKKELSSEYKKIELQGKIFGVIRIVFKNGESYEIATFRKDGKYSDGIHPDNVEFIEDAEQDAKRRDFTINAMFYDPFNGNIIDYVGGLEDLENKKLKFVGNPEQRIYEDKSRIIRYVRFLFQTGFKGDKLSNNAIKDFADRINFIPKELLKKELDKIISIANPGSMLELLDKLNLLKNIFPEIKQLEKIEQGPPYHMEGNVLKHTKMVCDSLPQNADFILKWTCIFHDIGKPESRKETVKEGIEKISFINHEKIGAEKVKLILKRLKFSKHEIKQIVWFIKNHLIVFKEYFLFLETNSEKIAKEKITRSLKNLINLTDEKKVFNLMTLALVDIMCSVPLFKNRNEEYMKTIFSCLEEANSIIKREKNKGIDIKKAVDGKLIMQYMKIKSGKRVGIIKKQIIKKLSDKAFDNERHLKREFKKIIKKLK